MPTLPAVTPELIKAYHTEISNSASPATLKRKQISLNRFFDWAEGQGHIQENPLSPQTQENPLFISKPKKHIGFKTWAVVGITGGLVALTFLLTFKLQIPIPFIKSRAQESTVQTGQAIPQTPAPEALISANSAVNGAWNLYAKLKLSDEAGKPQIGSQTLTFKLYNTEAGGTPLWTSDPKSITTDDNGSALISLDGVPTDLFFGNNNLFLEPETSSASATARIPVPTASNPAINSEGNLVLAGSSPSIKATDGNFLIEGQTVIIKTTDGSGGNIEINPDANGYTHFLFEGNKGNFLNAQAPNLTSGSLYYGMVPNNATGYDLIRLQSGSKLTTKFSVDSKGNTNIAGDFSTGGTDRLTNLGKLQNITGYSQTSGNFTISQNPGDFASITKTGTALNDVLTLTLDERGKPQNPNSDYSTLVLRRYDGNGFALLVDEGNARFDGQLQLGRFDGTPAAIGQGSLVFNTADNQVYVWDGTTWIAVGAGTGFSGSFGDLTSGTNTTAAMVVDSGASLNYTGTGTINASTLIGGTWAVPGTIGLGFANTGAFTTLSANSTVTFSGLTPSLGVYTDGSSNLTSTAPTSGQLGYWTRSGTNLYNTNLGDNVGIGTNAPGNRLTVTLPTTADALADVMIGTSATTQKGLVIQGKASQTANLQEWQTSTGSFLAGVTGAGFWGFGVSPVTNYKFNYSTTMTDITTNSGGIQNTVIGNYTASNTNQLRGTANYLYVNVGTGFTESGLQATYHGAAYVRSTNTGTINSLYGNYFYTGLEAGAGGSVGTMNIFDAGIYAAGANTTAFTSWKGLNIQPIAAGTLNGATIQNLYGVYVDSLTGGVNNYALTTNTGLVVLNEGGEANSNVRIEGDTNANLFFTNASTDRVGIGTNAPSNRLTVPWISGDAIPASYFGSTNSSNNQNAIAAYSYSAAAIYGQSNTYAGLYGTTVTGQGVYGVSTSTGVPLLGLLTDAGTTNVPAILRLNHRTSGVPAAGFGSKLIFSMHSSTNTDRDNASIESIWTDPADATRTSDMIFRTTNSTVIDERMRITGAGYVGIGDTSPLATLTVGAGDKFQVAGATGNITTAGDLAVNGGDITSTAATFNLLNENTAQTINLGSGTGGNTINIAGTGATGTDTINIGTGGTNADTITIGNTSASTNVVLTKGASGNITLTGYNCWGGTNNGKLTTDTSGNVICGNDIGGSGATNVPWSGLTDPSANLSLNHTASGQFTTTMNWTATGALNPWTMNLTNNAGGATTQNFVTIANAVTSQTNDINTESLLLLDNADTLASGGSTVVDNAILITNSGAITNGITDAIDASATEIVNALNFGTNVILGTTGNIDMNNFDVVGSTGNITTAGDLAVNGGDISSTATTFNIDVGNTGTIQFRDGTYALAAVKDQGDYVFWNLKGKTDTGNPVTCAEGDIYYNAFDDTVSICHTGNVWEQLDGGGGSWSSLTDPIGNLTLNMGAWNTTFNWVPVADTAETNFSLTTQGNDTVAGGEVDQVLLALSQTDNSANVDQAADALLTLTNSDANDPVTNAIRFDAGGGGGFTYGINFDAASIGTAEIILQNAETIDNIVNGTLALTSPTLAFSSTTTLTASSLATFTSAASLAMSSTSTLTLASNATINGGSAANDDLTLQGTSDSTRTTSYVNLQPTAGYVGIATTAPESTLQIGTPYVSTAIGNTPITRIIGSGNSQTTETLLRLTRKGVNNVYFPAVVDFNVYSFDPSGSPNFGPGTQLDIALKAASSWTETATVNVMSLRDDGNVGIGDTSPLATLTVGDTDKFQVAGATGNITTAGDLAVNGGDISSATGNLTLQPAGAGTTANIQIGVGGAGSGTPDLLVLDAKNLTGNPAGTNGAMYYNVADAKFKCYENSAWTNCVGAGSNKWNALTSPDGNLTLAMLTNTTEFNWDTGTGTNNLFSFTTDASSNGTGSLLNIQTGSSSTVLPLRVRAGSVEAITVDASGNVGMGNASPTTALHIGTSAETHALSTGDVLISDILELDGVFYLDGSTMADKGGEVMLGLCTQPGADPCTDITQIPKKENTLTGATWVVTNSTNVGKAALIVDQYKNGDIFTASDSGTPRFTIAKNGTVTITTTNGATVASLIVTDSSGTGTGKINVGTVDPPYTINGKKFATFLSGMVGIKEEVTGSVDTDQYIEGVGYRHVIDFNSLPEESDLWLFSKTTNIIENIDKLVALLTPANPTTVWYEVDKVNGRLIIYSARPTTISYRLTGPRFDYQKWANRRDDNDPSVGFVINNPDIAKTINEVINVQKLSDYIIEKSQDAEYTIKNSAGEIIDGIQSAGNFVAGNIRAGTLTAYEIFAPKITTSLISPVPGEDLAVELPQNSKFKVQDQSQNEVASIDAQGNATFSGELYADSVHSQNIDEIQALLNEVKTDQSVLSEIVNGSTSLTASDSASLTNLVTTDLYVTNQAAFNSLSVTKTVTIGSDLIFGSENQMVNGNWQVENTLNSLSAPLKIQSLAMAPIEMMAGLVTIDTHGNVNIAGNLNVAGKITAPSANISDVSLQNLTVAAPSDVTASAQIINGEIQTNASAGKAIIPANISEIVIRNSSITNYTLVYVTPTSTTGNNVLYVKSKSDGFVTIGFTDPLEYDVSFNWWFIQTQP